MTNHKKYDYHFWLDLTDKFSVDRLELMYEWKKKIDNATTRDIVHYNGQYCIPDKKNSNLLYYRYSFPEAYGKIDIEHNLDIELSEGAVYICYTEADLKVIATYTWARSNTTVSFYHPNSTDYHNPYGPARVICIPSYDHPIETEYYLYGKNITKWLDKKGYTMPLSDKEQYECRLTF